MGLRGLLKKKDRGDDSDADDGSRPSTGQLAPPEFTFIRSDTYTQEVIEPPTVAPADDSGGHLSPRHGNDSSVSLARRSLDVFKSSRGRSESVSSRASTSGKEGSAAKRLSHRLHLSRSPSTSSNVPEDLPEIVMPAPVGGAAGGAGGAGGGAGAANGHPDPRHPVSDEDDERAAQLEKENVAAIESQWEKRATILALSSERNRSRPVTPEQPNPYVYQEERLGGFQPSRNRSASVVSSKEMDADIQEAIRLHEEGQLAESTRMFGILADPKGYNNPLSQVLYGLALRHGWGCMPDTEAAVKYLSAAASNAAAVESLALQAGLKKGGAAKGELVLAIFELANCFRHGWGIDKDPIAAKQYYETAANLGDTDAMNEIGWCYLEGFGCKKDKFASAKYYRLAEQNGNKTLGNSWIWKEKYDPDKQKKK